MTIDDREQERIDNGPSLSGLDSWITGDPSDWLDERSTGPLDLGKVHALLNSKYCDKHSAYYAGRCASCEDDMIEDAEEDE